MANTSKREGLLEEIDRENSKGPNRVKCSVWLVLSELSEQDKDDLVAALDNPNIKATVIATVLTNRGYVISDFSVRRHKLKRCACGRIK